MEDLLSPLNKVNPSLKRNTPCPSSPSPSPLIGVARPDLVPPNPKSVESVEALLGVNCNNASRISSIKDLRVHRVSTPEVNLVLGGEDDDGKKLLDGSDSFRVECKPEKKTALTSHRVRRVFRNSSSFSYRRLLPHMMNILTDDSNVPQIEFVDAVVPSKLQKLDGVKSQKVPFAANIYTGKVNFAGSELNDTTKPSQGESVAQILHTKVPFNQQGLTASHENEMGLTAEITTPPQPEHQEKVCGSDVDIVGASVEKECVQMTPPDPAIFPMENKLEQVEISEKSGGDVSRQSLGSKNGTNSINKPVLNPCSRRLFENQKSFNYRRMLPFLMNTSQNDPCDSRITQQPMPQVNLKKDTARENDDKQPIPIDDQTQNFLPSLVPMPTETYSDTNMDFSMSQLSPTKCSSNADPTSVTPEALPEPSVAEIDLHTDSIPQGLGDHRKVELCFDEKEIRTSLPPTQLFTINNDNVNKQPTLKESAPVGEPNNCLDTGSELCSNTVEANGRFDQKQSSFQTEASDAAVVSPAISSFRGILKRNRLGCRGLCNCLNCASFRLHADRAFEFSRNQMRDAEDVASGLMKELANLRFMLEKSITSDDDLGAIRPNPVLIKEACSKSLEAETLAKECLSQMNNDLDIHCRIPNILEPKVTFANCTQERAIPLSDPLASIERDG